MKTNVYIDGFNLYYCAVKGTLYKWLDLLTFSSNLFPSKNIHKIKYFSAKIKALRHDPSGPTRQDTYWRALRTSPQVEIIEGNFVAWPKLMPQYPLAYVNNDYNWPPQKVQVQKTEEKGSDVNLAAFLVYDNCIKEADESVVISNDSDLAKAIELVTGKLGRTVVVVNPNLHNNVRKDPKHYAMHNELQRVSSHQVLSINWRILANSQFSPTLSDSKGTFTKPATW